MHNVLHTRVDLYTNKFPNFGKPCIVGFFSLDDKRQYHANASNLKYFKGVINSKVSYDLNLKLHEVIRKANNPDEKLTNFLKFVLQNELRLNESLFNTAITLDNSYIYCFRGLLTCIACTPYENQETWRIVATLYKGNIYLCALDTDEKIKRLRNATDKDKQFTSWGFKFEQYCLSDSPNSMPDPNKPVNENEEFNLIFKTHLNNHRIIFGAEMDGIKCDNEADALHNKQMDTETLIEYLSTKEFVELKTCRHLEFSNQERNFRRFKTKKWWCQSFLVGINEVLCGFRNDEGIVQELKVYSVRELAKMSEKFWKPEVCFNFLNTFLTYVKRCLAAEIKYKYGDNKLKDILNLPLTSLHFEWQPGTPVTVTNNYIYDTDPILPNWFITQYGKYQNIIS